MDHKQKLELLIETAQDIMENFNQNLESAFEEEKDALREEITNKEYD